MTLLIAVGLYEIFYKHDVDFVDLELGGMGMKFITVSFSSRRQIHLPSSAAVAAAAGNEETRRTCPAFAITLLRLRPAVHRDRIYVPLLRWLGSVTVRTLDLRSRGRGFDSRSGRYQVVSTWMGADR